MDRQTDRPRENACWVSQNSGSPPFAKIIIFMARKLRHGWDQSMLMQRRTKAGPAFLGRAEWPHVAKIPRRDDNGPGIQVEIVPLRNSGWLMPHLPALSCCVTMRK